MTDTSFDKNMASVTQTNPDDDAIDGDNLHSDAMRSPSCIGPVRRRKRPTGYAGPPSSTRSVKSKTRVRVRPGQAATRVPNGKVEPIAGKPVSKRKLTPPRQAQHPDPERGAPKPGRDYQPLVHAKNGKKLDELDYETGYGKPPEKHKFVKGKSGNPKGRPKGSKGLKNILKDALNQKIVSRANGVEKKITTREGIIMRLIKKALDGDHNAIKLIMSKDEDFQLETLLGGDGAARSEHSGSSDTVDTMDEAILAEFARQLLEEEHK